MANKSKEELKKTVLVISFLLLSFSPKKVLATNPSEVWLSPRLDGIAGTGSQTDPFNASTQTKFDAIITSLGTQPVIVHLLPGNYQTLGVTIYSGWQIIGAGIDITKLTYVGNNTVNGYSLFAVIWSWLLGDDHASNMRVADLTIDGNVHEDNTNKVVLGVILRGGDNNTIERVRATNVSSPSTSPNAPWLDERFILWIHCDGRAWNSQGNIIRDSIVDNCHGNWCSGFTISHAAWSGFYNTNAVMERNRAIGVKIGYTSWNTKGLIIRDNYATNVTYGINIDSGHNYDTVISGNTINQSDGWGLNIGNESPNLFNGSVVENNDFSATSGVGLRFSGHVTNSTIRNNRIRGSGTLAIQIAGTGNYGFLFEGNTMESWMNVSPNPLCPGECVNQTAGTVQSQNNLKTQCEKQGVFCTSYVDPTSCHSGTCSVWQPFAIAGTKAECKAAYCDCQCKNSGPSPTPTPFPGDLNNDSHVNAADFSLLVKGYDTIYNDSDYQTLKSHYGQ